jgi:hypothetical protein
MQRRLRANPCSAVANYYMRQLCVRGDAILWFYRDFDLNDGHHEHLVIAKLDGPDGVATQRFRLDLDLVWNNHVFFQRSNDLYGLGSQRTAACPDYEVLIASAFIRYELHVIYLYHIPHPSPGTQSQDGNDKLPSLSVVWSSSDRN